MNKAVRVLIVEDHDELRDHLKVFFQRRGIEADAIATAYGALSAMRISRPKVLITDILMPDMSGMELIQAVRRDWPDVRIVAMSGDRMILADALTTGAELTLLKPFTSVHLWHTVAPLLP